MVHCDAVFYLMQYHHKLTKEACNKEHLLNVLRPSSQILHTQTHKIARKKTLLYFSFLSKRVRARATTRETPIKFFSLRSACLCKLMLVTSRRAKVTCGEP